MNHTHHLLLVALTLMVALGCGEANDGDSDETPGTGIASDAIAPDTRAVGEADAAAAICSRPLGSSCLEDGHCESGTCLVSEFAPFGICVVACETQGDYCMGTDGNAYQGFWCIEPPIEEFKKHNHPEVERFCLPICSSVEECQALDPGYEECSEAVYKGNPLYPGSPMPVCQSPSAMGKAPVDPFTCANWKVTNPGNSNEKLLCDNYCAYLKSCQYYEPAESLDCCSWYCYGRLVQIGFVDGEYEDTLRNFTEWFIAFAGTAQQCEAKAEFGAPPIPDENKPTPDAFLCDE